MDSKLNSLLKDLPQGTVAAQTWLEQRGVYRQLTRRYVASGWLERFGRGAFVRAGDSVDWYGAVYTLQAQLRLDVHVAGETALLLKGHGHFLPLREGYAVRLFGKPGERLPSWFTRHSWPVRLDYRTPRLFEQVGDCGIGSVTHNSFLIRVSTRERAILEAIHLAATNEALVHAHQLMSGLTTLRPDIVQILLNGCRSVKVKRYFLWSAETAGHTWMKKVNRADVDLGRGKRQLYKNGAYDPKYKITVPPSTESPPDV